jgi:hypothetical protein
MKLCSCGIELNEQTASPYVVVHGGICRKCRVRSVIKYRNTTGGKLNRKKVQQKYMQRKHREFRNKIDAIKLSSGCIDCLPGVVCPSVCLQFDHKDPSKKSFKVAAATSRCWNIVLKEISKCVVRCANHHAIKTSLFKEHGRKPK